MKSMLIAVTVTGAFIAGLLLTLKNKRLKSSSVPPLLEDGVDGEPVRSMKYTMG